MIWNYSYILYTGTSFLLHCVDPCNTDNYNKGTNSLSDKTLLEISNNIFFKMDH